MNETSHGEVGVCVCSGIYWTHFAHYNWNSSDHLFLVGSANVMDDWRCEMSHN